MAKLQNVRRERVAQNLAKGMSADASHTAAGYKPSRQNVARMSTYDDIVGRVAELQGSTAKQITDVRDAVVSDSWWKFDLGVAPSPYGHSIMRRGQGKARLVLVGPH